jgi:DNA repair protein RecO (recombination protein O)
LAVPTYEDEGIIIRRAKYSEADRVLTIFTKDHGKVGALAKGVRKSSSTRSALVDLFTRCHLQLAKGRGELDVLGQVSRIGKPFPIDNAAAAACASVCAELTDKSAENHHPDPEAYRLLTEGLELCGGKRDPRTALTWFTRRFMAHLGYGPQLSVCANCHRKLPQAPAAFSAVSGGLLCASCEATDPTSVEASVATIKAVRLAALGDAETFWRLKFSEQMLSECVRICDLETAFHLGKELRSFGVLRSILTRS